MNIGIIIYSRTGHTHSVATRLMHKLVAAGHTVKMERLQPVGATAPGTKHVQFATLPNPAQYDALVFGSAVEAFTLSAVMASYLQQIASLRGKQVACLVTEGFPLPSMGGNQAIAQMKSLLESKGATVRGAGIVNWLNLRRGRQIAQVVDQLSDLFGSGNWLPILHTQPAE